MIRSDGPDRDVTKQNRRLQLQVWHVRVVALMVKLQVLFDYNEIDVGWRNRVYAKFDQPSDDSSVIMDAL